MKIALLKGWTNVFPIIPKYLNHFTVLVRSLNSLLKSMEYLIEDRVIGMYKPNYKEGSDLFNVLKGAVVNRCSNIAVNRSSGY